MGSFDSEIRSYYEKFIYGKWRDGEIVTYKVMEESVRASQPEKQTSPMTKLPILDDGVDVQITVSNNAGRQTMFTVRVYAPKQVNRLKHPNGNPFIICLHPIGPKQYALEHGYGVIFIDSITVASDNTAHTGAFYDLYPYGADADSQTGVLMAWAWGASKVLDAVYAGMGAEFGFSAKDSIVTGVSRWGKATAVCGAFDNRFRMTAPTCSGAGGLALWKFVSEGMSYNLTKFGGPSDYVYGQNEPLGALQSDSERGWFNDKFLEFGSPEEILVEQYLLPELAAGEDRYYFIIAAWMGEDWVNAPAMWECYKKALELYKKAGLEDHIQACFHKEGHAVLEEDLVQLIEYFDSTIGA